MTWFRRPDPESDPESWGHPDAFARPVRVWSQVVFVEIDGASLLLDCVATEEASGGWGAVCPGHPFTLQVDRPGLGWRAAVLATLDEWAELGTPVEIELSRHGPGAQAQMSDGNAVAIFDLLALSAT